MFRVTRISDFAGPGAQRATQAWQTINTQPSWIVKAATLVFLLVVGIPILLLVLLALILATAVFAVLWGVNRVLAGFRGVLPRNDGRENVRVIRRVDGP
jgi:hypothetical protein